MNRLPFELVYVWVNCRRGMSKLKMISYAYDFRHLLRIFSRKNIRSFLQPFRLLPFDILHADIVIILLF